MERGAREVGEQQGEGREARPNWWSFWLKNNFRKCKIKFLLALMGVLAPRLRTLDGSARPPIDTTEIFPHSVNK